MFIMFVEKSENIDNNPVVTKNSKKILVGNCFSYVVAISLIILSFGSVKNNWFLSIEYVSARYSKISGDFLLLKFEDTKTRVGYVRPNIIQYGNAPTQS